jgi:ribosomal protein L11 methylase PrmA
MSDKDQLSASFRDPSGFLFRRDGTLYRQVNKCYAADYQHLMESGLYAKLTKLNLLIPHREVETASVEHGPAFKIIQPEVVTFISYPYEWAFSLLKDAALVTLKIQRIALKYDMSLKDASAYNIQLHKGHPTLIDTLSFEKYIEGKPWVAYRQFCQHFLAPLALMAHTDVRLGKLMRVYIDGIPLDLAARLLPARSWFNFGLLIHTHIHAQAQKRSAGQASKLAPRLSGKMSKDALGGLIEGIEATVKRLEWKPGGTEWGDYYNISNYTDSAFEHKKELVSSWLERVRPASVWDLGANDGTFSRLASGNDIHTVAFDIDPTAVEINYRQVRSRKEQNLIPLLFDRTNPSPSIGWHNQERDSLFNRGPVDMILSLALIHHLAISNNVPLSQLADFYHDMGHWLIIEFILKSDSQVKKLLENREDIFHQYNQSDFEQNFKRQFTIHEKVLIRESERSLYLMERKG